MALKVFILGGELFPKLESSTLQTRWLPGILLQGNIYRGTFFHDDLENPGFKFISKLPTTFGASFQVI
jgi:hypothetical protein